MTEPNETELRQIQPDTGNNIFDEGTTFELTEGDSQPPIPGEKDEEEISDFVPPAKLSPKRTVVSVVNRRKVMSQRWNNSDRPKINPPPQQ